MASINGVELKNLSTFRGHEGERCYQASVYLNGDKIGTWSQDAWCGPDIFSFDESILDKQIKDFQAGYDDSYRYKEICDSADIFLYELARLTEAHKDIKRGFESHFAAVYAVGYKGIAWRFDNDTIDEALLSRESIINDLKERVGDDAVITVFHPNQMDFIINEDNPSPRFFYR